MGYKALLAEEFARIPKGTRDRGKMAMRRASMRYRREGGMVRDTEREVESNPRSSNFLMWLLIGGAIWWYLKTHPIPSANPTPSLGNAPLFKGPPVSG